MEIIKKGINFVKDDIWRIRITSLPKGKSKLIQLLRMAILTIRGFTEDKCQLRASALTFYTLISIVPILALAFGIAKGFGYEQVLQNKLVNEFPNSQEVIIRAISIAKKLLEQTKGEVVAGVGVIMLFWALIKVLKSIEASLNEIWGIKKHRTFTRQLIDYVFFTLVCLFMLTVSSGFTIYAATKLTNMMAEYGVYGASTFQAISLKLVPYFASWLLFCFVYIFMPNAKVNWKAALIAGIVAGSCYQIAQWVFINFQVFVAKYNAIYGSFSALPLFMMWLQLSWMIVFFGAEVAFAYQNTETFEFESDTNNISPAHKRLITLCIMHKIIKSFCNAERPWTVHRLSHELEIPIRLVRQILYDLMESNLIVELLNDANESAYQPATSPEKYSILYVLNKIDKSGSQLTPIKSSPSLENITEKLTCIGTSLENVPANILLKDI